MTPESVVGDRSDQTLACRLAQHMAPSGRAILYCASHGRPSPSPSPASASPTSPGSMAGPQATRILADLGAEVIRVENESHLDSMRIGCRSIARRRQLQPQRLLQQLQPQQARHHRQPQPPRRARGRRAADRGLGHRASRTSAPASSSAWASAASACSELNPRIIYISISGFGHTGRDTSYVTWGPTAAGGLRLDGDVRAARTSRRPAGATPTSTTPPATTARSPPLHGALPPQPHRRGPVHRHRPDRDGHDARRRADARLPGQRPRVRARSATTRAGRPSRPTASIAARTASTATTAGSPSRPRRDAQWHALCDVLGAPELTADDPLRHERGPRRQPGRPRRRDRRSTRAASTRAS